MSMGLQQTAHSFQTEWFAVVLILSFLHSFSCFDRYELSVTGQLGDQHKYTVPDVYAQ